MTSEVPRVCQVGADNVALQGIAGTVVNDAVECGGPATSACTCKTRNVDQLFVSLHRRRFRKLQEY
jgi:hypothetical protein